MSHLFRALAVLAITTAPGVALAQCTKDTDCKGDRVCEEGVCVSPDERVDQVSPPPLAPPPPAPTVPPPARRHTPPPLQTDRANVISLNPLSTVGAYLYGVNIGVSVVQISVIYERVVLPQLSVYGTLTPAITGGDPPTTLGLMGGARWYFLGGAPGGPWVGAELGLLPLNFGVGLSPEAGWQWALDSGLALGVHVGVVFGAGAAGLGLGATIGWNF